MKAIEYSKYGSPEVLKMIEVEKPEPKDDEVLVKIHATTVTATEATFRKGDTYMTRLYTGLTKPKLKRLGEEFSGTIEATGKLVKIWKPGDQVFGTAGPDFGANAEYLCIPSEGVISAKPEKVSFEEAAGSIDGFLTALPFLRDAGKIKSGQKVLIYGASGSIGSAAVQVASYYGAHVTGVCSSTNRRMVSQLGAAKTIDYTSEDFTQNGETYDIIFDAVGKLKYSKCKKALSSKGIFLEAGMDMRIFLSVMWSSLFNGKKAKVKATGLRPPLERTEDLKLLRSLMKEGKIKPVIDQQYPLSKIVEAHRYVDGGHKKGNVVIRIHTV